MDLNKLSVCYTVLDYDSGEIKEITVVDSDDLYAITGMFTGQEHCVQSVVSRFPSIQAVVENPQDVTWYAATEENFCLEHALKQAKSQNNTVIVVEMLPGEDEDVGVWQPSEN